MKFKHAKPRVQQLTQYIRTLDQAYYTKNTSLVTDAEYDTLMAELRSLEEKHPILKSIYSPTRRLMPGVTSKFQEFKHFAPMLSIKTVLNSVTDAVDVFKKEVDQKLIKLGELPPSEEVEYTAELKYDGLALNLLYLDGELVSAGTRGDGYIGEDVTRNARMIPSIPLRLLAEAPKRLEVRGEVLMYRDAFKALNERCIASGEETYKNPRNAASGSLRQLDPAITKERRLNFVAYGIGDAVGFDASTQYELLQRLSKMGFSVFYTEDELKQTPPTSRTDKLKQFKTTIADHRDMLPFDIDGVVYKVNRLSLQRKLGFTGREPNWAIAHKFAGEEATSTLLGISLQVGRLGTITPVANIKPVHVAGTTISNITLHNQDEIDRKDIRIGDIVMVRRAGDVIPEIYKVLHELRLPGTKPYRIKDHLHRCPCCGSRIEREEGKSAYRCTGSYNCPAQQAKLIEHYASRTAMRIEGLGEVIAEQLVNTKLATRIDHLYTLTEEKLSEDLSLGKLTAKKLMKQIYELRVRPDLNNFIYALGIPNVGRNTAANLAAHFKTIEEFIETTDDKLEQSLLSISDIGLKTASSIMLYLEVGGRDIIRNILAVVQPKPVQLPDTQAVFSGKIFVITGSFGEVKRDVIQKEIEARGGRVTGKVSKQVSYLVLGDSPGSKLKDAETLGVPSITLEQLRSLF